MEIQGPTLSVQTQDGQATVTLFYESSTGQPTRIASESSTQRAYKVELEGSSPQTLNFLIPLGNASRDVPNPVAKGIDARADVAGTFENNSIWTLRLDV